MNQENQLEDYLKELIQDKPSSRIKLFYAWDGLSQETQIKVLHRFKSSISNKLRLKALKNSNAYIRYLIAKSIDNNSCDQYERWLRWSAKRINYNEYKARYRKCNSDLQIVVNSLLNDKAGFVREEAEDMFCFPNQDLVDLRGSDEAEETQNNKDAPVESDEERSEHQIPKPFFAKAVAFRAAALGSDVLNNPHYGRLVRISQEERILWLSKEVWNPPDVIPEIAEGLISIITEKALPEVEIEELIEEHFKNNQVLEYYKTQYFFSKWSFFWDSYPPPPNPEETLQKMWEILPGLGICKSAWSLISHLPPVSGVSEKILESVDKILLEKFFWRQDVELNSFRKKMFLTSEDSSMQTAASRHNFNLEHKEFDTLLKNDRNRLNNINWSSDDISLVFIFALNDCGISGDECWHETLRHAHDLKEKMEKETCALIEGKNEQVLKEFAIYDQLRQLAIYSIAKTIVPWEVCEKTTKTEETEKFDNQPEPLFSERLEKSLKSLLTDSIPYETIKRVEPLYSQIIERLSLSLKNMAVLNDTWGTFMNFSHALRSEWIPLLELLPTILDAKLPPRDIERLFSDSEYSDKIFAEEKINVHLSQTLDLKERINNLDIYPAKFLVKDLNVMQISIAVAIVISILAWIF